MRAGVKASRQPARSGVSVATRRAAAGAVRCRGDRLRCAAASGASGAGLLLEADGTFLDIADGHRLAFNAAFHSIGFDCVSWSPPVFHDLLTHSDGTGEGLVRAYYSTVGWPVMIPTAERDAFVRKIYSLKQNELAKLLTRDGVPLRPDVRQVVADAVADGAAVSLLCGTQCTQAEAVAASAQRLLGEDLAAAVRVFTFSLAPAEGGGGGGGGAGAAGEEPTTPILSQMLSAAAGDLKQRAALQLVCRLQAAERGSEGGPVALTLDPSLWAAGGAQQRISPEFLSALIATTGVPAARTVAVAATNSTLQAGASAGTYTVAIPRKFATQGSFPSARAKFDGWGSGLATWPRLRSLMANGSGSGKR